MNALDPNLEWLGHVQPVGLVVAPAVLTRHGLVPEEQIRTDGHAVTEHLAGEDEGPALLEPWSFFADVLGWDASQVAGAPGGPDLPDELSVHLPEADTTLAPSWAVAEPDGGWQMLVRIEEPDARGALAGWEATAHQRLERLLRERGVPAGALITDRELRLVHAPRGETSGWLAFPLRELATVGGRPMLGGLKLLLSSFRLFSDASDRRLPSLLRASREAQAEVSAKLATQVLGALHDLLRGLHAADRARVERLATERSEELYEGLLTVLLRFVFLLYAEDRTLIPSRGDGPARALYEEGYGVRALHARLLGDRARHPDTMDERRGAWGRLLALFRLVHKGDGTGWIRGRGGKLFDTAVFPFLEGRDVPEDRPAPAPVTDGCILRVLDGLLMLGGERLSYRTLDVEQIGSVYETVMGFTVTAMRGRALAIRAGKNNHTPVFVDLDALAALKGKARGKYLKEEADRGQLPAKVAAALAAAEGADAVAAALAPIVDERGSPGGHPAPVGAPLLQPTEERRRTGSHYTPRTLTEPIVRHALEPAFARIGEEATPDDVLALKVCDPAMGSGAFLVEACRQLATRLTRAWTVHPGTRPAIPDDEDEDLLARRLVAQRCLYGVDRNPMAVDLTRLSLWLATLARDHEFTFLDHALKSGDSLVGLTREQIGHMTWAPGRGSPLLAGHVRERMEAWSTARREIRTAPDTVTRAEQEVRLTGAERDLRTVREVADALVATFFAGAKATARRKALKQFQADFDDRSLGSGFDLAARMARDLREGERPVTPFHWEVEFPEVFGGEAPGFDAVVGNPPFLGGRRVTSELGDAYNWWLADVCGSPSRNADLVAHFFRQAFGMLRPGGAFGLIATNTIGQGDTRVAGLAAILTEGGAILRAEKRRQWPGAAAVVVSVVHVRRGAAPSPVLDGRQVGRVSAYLVPGDYDASPHPLAENAGRAFQGSILLGMGFTFDDAAAAKGKAEPLAEMERLIALDPRNAQRIKPYLGGEEVNTSLTHAHDRYAIDFEDFPLRRDPRLKPWHQMERKERDAALRTGVVPGDYPRCVAADWPDLLEIVERRVKPDRRDQKRDNLRNRWWRYAEHRPGLLSAIGHLDWVPVTNCAATPHLAPAFVPADQVFANTLAVFAYSNLAPFAALQSRVHEVWARFFSSSMKDDLRYAPSDCFETFPFPPGFDTDPALKEAGRFYLDHRAGLMEVTGKGITKTYNDFHDANLRRLSNALVELRDLHAEMDRAVLRAYGWDDLAEAAAPVFLAKPPNEKGRGERPGEPEEEHIYQGRLHWPSEFRDEVLARLLDLNRRRAAEERARGLSARGSSTEDEEDAEDGFSFT